MESRREKRFAEQNPVFIRDKNRALKSFPEGGIEARTHDISVSGAWICCRQDFPIGYAIRLVIDLEGSEQFLNVDGEVVWSRRNDDERNFDIGVEFLHDLPGTVLTILDHLYGKRAGVPSRVS